MYKQLIRQVPFLLVSSAFLLGSNSYAQSQNPTDADASSPPPKKGFFSSLGDSLKQAIDPKAVRGYFDVGSQRYYCLIDTKTGAKQANAVQGQLVPSGNGQMTLKNATQSLLSCDQAETNGNLVLNSQAAATSQTSLTAGTKGSSPGPSSAGPAANGGGPLQTRIVPPPPASSQTRVGTLGISVLSLDVGEPLSGLTGIMSSATLTLAIVNHGKSAVVVDLVPSKSLITNEHGYAWRAAARTMTGVPGSNGTMTNSMTMVDPEGEARIAVPLTYGPATPGQTAGTSFSAAVELVAAEFNDKGPVPPLRHYPVSFSNLRRAPPSSPGMEKRDEQEIRSGYPSEEVGVGDLGFKVWSLRVAEPPLVGVPSNAVIYLEASNHGTRPISLAHVGARTLLVNEYNYYWQYGGGLTNAPVVTGLPDERNSVAATYSVIGPGEQFRFAIALFGGPHVAGQTTGATFDFADEFDAFENLGEGRLRKLRTYPVAFTGLHRTADSARNGGQLSDSPPSMTIGDFRFDLAHFEVVSKPGYKLAKVGITVTSHAQSQVNLRYDFGTGSMIDDLAIRWVENPAILPTGVGFYTTRWEHVGTPHPIAPGQSITGELNFYYEIRAHDGKEPGSIFDFAGQFCTIDEVGQGKAQLGRCYPVAFTGIHN